MCDHCAPVLNLRTLQAQPPPTQPSLARVGSVKLPDPDPNEKEDDDPIRAYMIQAPQIVDPIRAYMSQVPQQVQGGSKWSKVRERMPQLASLERDRMQWVVLQTMSGGAAEQKQESPQRSNIQRHPSLTASRGHQVVSSSAPVVDVVNIDMGESGHNMTARQKLIQRARSMAPLQQDSGLIGPAETTANRMASLKNLRGATHAGDGVSIDMGETDQNMPARQRLIQRARSMAPLQQGSGLIGPPETPASRMASLKNLRGATHAGDGVSIDMGEADQMPARQRLIQRARSMAPLQQGRGSV